MVRYQNRLSHCRLNEVYCLYATNTWSFVCELLKTRIASSYRFIHFCLCPWFLFLLHCFCFLAQSHKQQFCDYLTAADCSRLFPGPSKASLPCLLTDTQIMCIVFKKRLSVGFAISISLTWATTAFPWQLPHRATDRISGFTKTGTSLCSGETVGGEVKRGSGLCLYGQSTFVGGGIKSSKGAILILACFHRPSFTLPGSTRPGFEAFPSACFTVTCSGTW